MSARVVGSSVQDQEFDREHTYYIYIALYRAMRARGVSLSAQDQYFRGGSYIAGTCEYQEWEHTYFRYSPIQRDVRLADHLTVLE